MSRRGRNVIFTGCLLLLVALVLFDRSPIRRNWQRRPQSDQEAKAYDFEKYHGKTFKVTKVVDGDTIDIDVPDGKYEHTRIRLWGIDAPETRDDKNNEIYFGKEAAEFAGELTLGKKVTVYLDEGNRTRGKYGRLLAYVQLPDRTFLNEVMVAEGFAYADLRFRHSLYQKYKDLQASARRQKKGLWEEAKRDQLPQWLQDRRPDLLLDK
jgi:micrococcal nuclease